MSPFTPVQNECKILSVQNSQFCTGLSNDKGSKAVENWALNIPDCFTHCTVQVLVTVNLCLQEGGYMGKNYLSIRGFHSACIDKGMAECMYMTEKEMRQVFQATILFLL